MEDLDSVKKRQDSENAAKKGQNQNKAEKGNHDKADGIVFDAGDGAKKTNPSKKP